MLEGSARPYLFGEAQRPACVQCRNDTLWAHMCLYQSHGPVCPRADQARLTREFVGRCAPEPYIYPGLCSPVQCHIAGTARALTRRGWRASSWAGAPLALHPNPNLVRRSDAVSGNDVAPTSQFAVN